MILCRAGLHPSCHELVLKVGDGPAAWGAGLWWRFLVRLPSSVMKTIKTKLQLASNKVSPFNQIWGKFLEEVCIWCRTPQRSFYHFCWTSRSRHQSLCIRRQVLVDLENNKICWKCDDLVFCIDYKPLCECSRGASTAWFPCQMLTCTADIFSYRDSDRTHWKE